MTSPPLRADTPRTGTPRAGTPRAGTLRAGTICDQPLLMLAPNLAYPAHNGSDVTLVELARSFSARLPRVVVVAAQDVVTYTGGEETGRRPYGGQMRSKPAAAARAALRQSHYYLEKFVTPAFAREAEWHLARPEYGAVFHSYLTTATLAGRPGPSHPHVVWSHNDEFKWFEDLRDASRNPVAKAAASASLRWLGRFLRAHKDGLTLLHVTAEDEAGWERRVPGHRSAVVPIGVALRGTVAPPREPGEPVGLVFAAALGVRMNLDALAHFAERYLPALRARVGDGLTVTVVGSTPLPEVRALCEREGWLLRADVSEDEMDARFREATFSLLPFPYATGAKLKLLKSLAYGVPFLATTSVGAQADLVAPPSLMSDSPDAWADHAATVRDRGVSAADRDRLRSLAEANSWDATAARVLDVIERDVIERDVIEHASQRRSHA